MSVSEICVQISDNEETDFRSQADDRSASAATFHDYLRDRRPAATTSDRPANAVTAKDSGHRFADVMVKHWAPQGQRKLALLLDEGKRPLTSSPVPAGSQRAARPCRAKPSLSRRARSVSGVSSPGRAFDCASIRDLRCPMDASPRAGGCGRPGRSRQFRRWRADGAGAALKAGRSRRSRHRRNAFSKFRACLQD